MSAGAWVAGGIVVLTIIILIIWLIMKSTPSDSKSCSDYADESNCTTNSCMWDGKKCNDKPTNGGDKPTPGTSCNGSIPNANYIIDNSGNCVFSKCKDENQYLNPEKTKCIDMTKCKDCSKTGWDINGDKQSCYTDSSNNCVRGCESGYGIVYDDVKKCIKLNSSCIAPGYENNMSTVQRLSQIGTHGENSKCKPLVNKSGKSICNPPYSFNDQDSGDPLNCKNIKIKIYTRTGKAGTPATYTSYDKNDNSLDHEKGLDGEGDTSTVFRVPEGGNLDQYCYKSLWSKYGGKHRKLTHSDLENLKSGFVEDSKDDDGNRINKLTINQCQKGNVF